MLGNPFFLLNNIEIRRNNKIWIKTIIISKMTIGSHFMISMKFKNWWVLIYLNTSRQIQIDSSFEFNCSIRRLSGHKFALFEFLWCITFDNLTESWQKNTLKLAETQSNLYYFWILINLLGFELNFVRFVPMSLKSDFGIKESSLIMNSTSDSSLTAISVSL